MTKKNKVKESIEGFAITINDMLKSDRWVCIVGSGEMGEGKSCITSQLAKKLGEITKIPFSYENNMTYLRSELKTWVEGDEKGKHQKPEYSSILADELISMFFKRNWYDSDQIDGIELLNKCRDRHICVIGNVPNFWDLDSAIYPIVTFRVHIFRRGIAWIFKKDENPFTKDAWHRKHNEKVFAKYHSPYMCKGFVCEIDFEDWSPEDKKRYYEVRNTKRKGTEGQRKKDHRNVKQVKIQRDKLIRLIDKPRKEIAIMLGLSEKQIFNIRNVDDDDEIEKIRSEETVYNDTRIDDQIPD